MKSVSRCNQRRAKYASCTLCGVLLVVFSAAPVATGQSTRPVGNISQAYADLALAFGTSTAGNVSPPSVAPPTPTVMPQGEMATVNLNEVLADQQAIPAGNGCCPNASTQSGARTICGVDCSDTCAPCNATWDDERPIPWSVFGQGEYIGPPRTAHVPQYFLRVDDELNLIFMLSRDKTSQPYRLSVGDQIQVESAVDTTLVRTVEIQSDGTISLPLLGEVNVAGKSVQQLRTHLNELYEPEIRNPQITVTPIQTNSVYQAIIDSVDRRSGAGGLNQSVKITPEGTIQLPGLGSVLAQGLSLDELKREIEQRYADRFGPGLSVTPLLSQRAPRFIFVVGEVRAPGRYTLEGPTTVMQSIALAGGWNVGGNTNHIVIFRRDENWCLKATRVDVRAALYGKDPCPTNDVWLRDNDLVLVPKRPILVADDIVELYFTRGIYRVFPISFVKSFGESTVLPVGP